MGQVVSFVGVRVRAIVRAASNMIMRFIRHVPQYCTTIIRGLPNLPQRILNYALAHPFRMLMHVGNVLTFIIPGLVWVPLVRLLGFGMGGVVGGSLAASIQSVIGPVSAGSGFALLQSAATGGHGVAAANAIIRTGIAAGEMGGAIASPDLPSRVLVPPIRFLKWTHSLSEPCAVEFRPSDTIYKLDVVGRTTESPEQPFRD